MLDIQERAKLVWHCRRGMLELDLILNKFVDRHLNALSKSQLTNFKDMLDYTDPELLAWLMGQAIPPKKGLQEIVHYIRTVN